MDQRHRLENKDLGLVCVYMCREGTIREYSPWSIANPNIIEAISECFLTSL